MLYIEKESRPLKLSKPQDFCVVGKYETNLMQNQEKERLDAGA